jgi:hypothetical protein
MRSILQKLRELLGIRPKTYESGRLAKMSPTSGR